MVITDEASFLKEMIPHHQEAVDTARLLLETTQNPQLKDLATSILQEQQAEIAMMNQRLQDRYPEKGNEPALYKPMMRDLSSITGSQRDIFRALDMMTHHEGAITMAQKILTIP
jgi:uncharacterized protein (DUF305 family)